MSFLRTGTMLFALAGACLAGTRPRPNPTDYKSQESKDGVTLAAEIIPADQVKNSFSTDLRGYVVVEVALYPDGTTPDINTGDFLLKCGANQMIRPANARAIPRVIQDRNAPKSSDIDIYPAATVGYESGPYHRGVYTSTGVGVGVGGDPRAPRPASTDQDRHTMQQELDEKGLPEGPVARPIAGYLYFPFPSNKQKTVSYELQYNGPSGRVRVNLN